MPEKTVKRRLQVVTPRSTSSSSENRPEKPGVNPHTCGPPNQFVCSLSQEGIGSI